MENILIYVLCIGIYIISALIFWLWLRKAHSAGGRWEAIDPDMTDVIYTFCPVINTALVISFLFKPATKKGIEKREKIGSKFFNIKK